MTSLRLFSSSIKYPALKYALYAFLYMYMNIYDLSLHYVRIFLYIYIYDLM